MCDDRPDMANTGVVPRGHGTIGRQSSDGSDERQYVDNPKHGQDTSAVQEVTPGSMQTIRSTIEKRVVSEKTTDIIMASWRGLLKNSIPSMSNAGFTTVVKNKLVQFKQI